ncbi:MAG: hypothetical protein JSV73_06695 [Flavobacteriaceae bacterium]|nr:MAG: hypothetical protein JSV73_06695 [Flavobacteriaceae bacterium]
MKNTAHTEYLQLESVLIKPVDSAFVSQEKIDQEWNDLNYLEKPDFELAKEEYKNFEVIFLNKKIKVHHLSENDQLSMDSMYCRDASIATDFGVILCRMGKTERQGEPLAQKEFFLEQGIDILGTIEAPGTLEGGDVAWLDERTLAVGHTYRTNRSGIEQLKSMLEPHGVEVVVIELPHYKGPSDVFHLMSIFSPVAEKLAVVYSPLMPIYFRNDLLRRGYELVEVPDEEFESMGCNVLSIGPKQCIMIEGNPVTEQGLRDKGCEIYLYKGEHISVMGGGGPTCLTRPLKRSSNK